MLCKCSGKYIDIYSILKITCHSCFRAINNGLLDTYQLKSLDGLLEAAVEDMVLERRNGRIYVQFPWDSDSLKHINAKKGVYQ